MKRFAVISVLLGAALLSVPKVTVRADEGGPDPDAFEQELSRVYSYQKRKRYKDGLKKLKKALEAHARQPYVRARCKELEDLAERMAFAEGYPAPEPASVVTGRIEKYTPRTGYLKISYTPDTARDLPRSGGLLWFPGVVRGDFLLEVHGRRYPQSIQRSPQIVFGGAEDLKVKEQEHVWHVIFGTPRRKVGTRVVWLPPSIHHTKDRRKKKVAEVEKCPAKIGRPFKVQVKATKSRVTSGVNGRAVGSARKPKHDWLRVGFAVDSWNRMIFAGVIEPALIQNRLDKVIQAQRREFKKKYKRTDYLPAWLFEKAATGPTPVISREALPAKLDPKLWPRVLQFESEFRKRDWTSARAAIESLAGAGAPEAVCTFLTARMEAETGRVKQGLEAIDKSLEKSPGFLGGLLLKGKLLRRLGRPEDAMRVFQDAITRHQKDPLAYETAATAMLFAARPDAAKKITELAARHGVSSPELDMLGMRIVKTINGPSWSKTYEHKSRNYHVFSNIDKSMCIEASRILEESLTAYRVNFQWVTRDKAHLYKVYVFSGREGFNHYYGELTGFIPPHGVAGVYNSLLKQLLIWNLPDRDVMLQTVRHEGFHQYLDRVAPDCPVWLNEGLAEYHESAIKKRGKLVFGQIDYGHLKALKKRGVMKLDKFIFQPWQEFRATGIYGYSMAWAFVHMLKEGKSEHRALFKKLIKDLQSEPAADVLARHFPPELLPELDTALRAHLNGLRKK